MSMHVPKPLAWVLCCVLFPCYASEGTFPVEGDCESISLLQKSARYQTVKANPHPSAQDKSDYRLEENARGANFLQQFPPKSFEPFLERLKHFKPPPYTTLIFQVTITWAIWIVLSLLVWRFFYPEDAELEIAPQYDPVKTFTGSHFGCFRTPMITFCACFCPALRWADTMNLAGILRFAAAFTAFAICALLNGLTYNLSIIYGFFTCFIILLNRQKLRAKLNLPNWTCKSCCADFFYVFCCTCCAIAQEARVVRYAYQQSHEARPAERAYAYRAEVRQPAPAVRVVAGRPIVTTRSPEQRL